ncbi:MAG: pyridoxal phosphate-dependent aminotransferase [Gemmataceae bacterium]
MIEISKLASSVKPSATLAAGAKAKQMKAEGIEVFDFSLGEPDFTTPQHICDAAYEAMKGGETHYTPAPGTAQLRKVIANWYEKTYGLQVAPDQVILSNGAKHSLHNALTVLCNPGDEVIIPTPYWVSYSTLVEITGAKPVLVSTTQESHFKMSPDQFRAAITPKTRVLMINSPCNPTGTVYTRVELEKLADIAIENDLVVISDEIYEQLVYEDNKATCFATLRPELVERTLTISGVSKSYAMTGWRMGWTLGPQHVIKSMGGIQSQQTGCPSSVTQAAVITALTGDQQCVQEMRREFAARREIVLNRLKELGFPCPAPGGAFYAFFDVSKHFGRTLGGRAVTDSMSFCQALLESVHVNLVPGAAFGTEGSVRMSFAASRDQIQGGLDRLEKFVAG